MFFASTLKSAAGVAALTIAMAGVATAQRLPSDPPREVLPPPEYPSDLPDGEACYWDWQCTGGYCEDLVNWSACHTYAGVFRDPCHNNSQCNSGFCLPDLDGSLHCSKSCVEQCFLDGFGCIILAEGNNSLCVEQLPPAYVLASCAESSSCQPGTICTSNFDCQSGFCIETPECSGHLGAKGVCTIPCVDLCPVVGMQCAQVFSSQGDPGYICVPPAAN